MSTKNIFGVLSISLLIGLLSISYKEKPREEKFVSQNLVLTTYDEVDTEKLVTQPLVFTSLTNPSEVLYEKKIEESKNEQTEEQPLVVSSKFSDEDIDLLALVTMAEAEGEPEEGKRLVVDTILNRVDSDKFPNTVSDVVYQKSQFSSMWNGRVDRCYVREDIRQLVIEEIESRKNYDVMFFTADRYSDYGKPMFRVGDHCFSSYN